MLKTCIILAAGLGTRMRPLTDDRPKPMVTIYGRPLIAYVIDMCLEAGIEQIIMNFHYKPQPLKDYIKAYYADHVILSDEQDLLLDSGGGVLKALEHTNASEFFVINADCIWHNIHNNALKQLYHAYNPSQFDVFKLLCNPTSAIGFDGKPIYCLDSLGHIHKNNDLTHEFTGIQILKRSLFDGYAIEPFSVRHIWQKAFDEKRIGGTEFEGQWLHIGTPQAVIDTEAYFKS
ncbi:MAG: MurNAc alpha-1-phosphate uridylyltransferase [Alphaproteobacteria bacterium]|jgi:MurNAc alpha-1-phosphate uridylyltransferase